MWSHALNIWRREMIDILRDRKSLRNALLTPIIMATLFALFSAFFGNIGAGSDQQVEMLEPEIIATIGKQNLPAEFLTSLSDLAVVLEPYAGSIEQLENDVRNGDVEMGLIVPESFAEDIAQGKPAAPIILETTSTSMNEMQSNNRLALAFEQYSSSVLAARLTERGIDPNLLMPVKVERRDVMFADDASRASRAGSVIAGLYIPLLLAMSIGSGGLSTAIDTTAGERDRGTLESLLLTPAGERGIFVGKTAKVVTMTVIPAALTVVTFIGVSQYIAPLIWEDYTPLSISMATVLFSILLCLPFILIVGLIQMVLALRAKSAKDAQSITSFFGLFVMFPMGAGAFVQPESQLLHLIPGFGTASVISKMVVAKPFLPYLPYVLLSTIALAVVAIWVGAQMFDREKLLFDG